MKAEEALATLERLVHAAGGFPDEHRALELFGRITTEARVIVVKLRRVDPNAVKLLADALDGRP